MPTGLPVAEAIKAFCGDEDAWSLYRLTKQRVKQSTPVHISPVIGNMARPRPGTTTFREHKRLVTAHQQAWRVLEVEFRSRLVAGELVGQGLLVPRQHGAEPVEIAKVDWQHGTIDWKRSTLSYGGLTYIDVKVRPTPSATEPSLTDAQIEAAEPYEGAAPVGRPTSMQVIRDELQRRIEQGELAASLNEQCRQLAYWFSTTHRDRDPYRWTSLKDPCRGMYRAARGQKK